MINSTDLISVCCSCQKVRIEEEWKKRPDLLILYKDKISHGICPPCAERLYPLFYKKSEKTPEAIIAF